MSIEQTFGMIKPNVYNDKDKSGNAIAIVNDIQNSGLRLVEASKTELTKEQAEEFYAEHKEKDWFHLLIGFMTSGPVLLMRIEGENAVEAYRDLCGATDPKASAPGTLRAKYGDSRDENSVHSSDSAESAKREIGFFF